jgi:ABC-type polysaccharide/polyol phosphate transport system ATPase subunit
MNVVEVEGVHKSFRIPKTRRATVREHVFGIFERREFDNLHVLRDLSFAIRRGESVGIMGRNGSGKSTLLRILSGIYRADRGRVAVHAPITPILALGVGWNAELTARDNLYLTGTAMGLSLKELDDQFDEIIAFAELERFVELQLKFYSNGMSARLAYAIAFHAVREVLLLDEVFAVGDAAFGERCRRRFAELHKAGHTMVLVSHDPATIADSCQRALLLEEGRILAEGDAREVGDRYQQLLVGPPPQAA